MTAEFGLEIARGGQGVVYAMPDGRIAKRFFDEVSAQAIRNEFIASRLAYDRGVPTWRADGVSKDGRAILGSRVAGEPFVQAASRRPWAVPSMMADVGRIHARIHGLEPLPTMRRWPIRAKLPLAEGALPGFTEAESARANEALAEAAVDPGFCHGDVAPNNLRVDGRRIAVLDWGRSGLGARALDVGRAYALFLCMSPESPLSTTPLLRRYRLHAADAYLAAYLDATGGPRLACELWAIVNLAREAGRPERASARPLLQAAIARLRARTRPML